MEANPNADILFNNMSGLQATEEGIEGHISNVKISLNATTGNFYLEGEESFTRGNYHHDARYSLPTPSPAGFKAALAHMIPDQGRIQSVAEDREIALAFYRATAGNPSDNSLPTVEDINAFRNIMLIFFNVPSKDGQPDKGAEIARLKETGLMRAESNVINPQRLNRLVTDIRRYFDIYRAYDELPPDFKYEHLLTISLLREADSNWRSVSYEELNNFTQTVVAVRQIKSDWRPATVLELEQLANKRVRNGQLIAQDLVEARSKNNNHQS